MGRRCVLILRTNRKKKKWNKRKKEESRGEGIWIPRGNGTPILINGPDKISVCLCNACTHVYSEDLSFALFDWQLCPSRGDNPSVSQSHTHTHTHTQSCAATPPSYLLIFEGKYVEHAIPFASVNPYFSYPYQKLWFFRFGFIIEDHQILVLFVKH